MRLSLVAFILLCSAQGFCEKVDYSKCANFLRRSPAYNGFIEDTHGLSEPRFDLLKDGQIVPHNTSDGVISYNKDRQTGNIRIIHVPSDRYSIVSRYHTTILRDSNGHIIRIEENKTPNQPNEFKALKKSREKLRKQLGPSFPFMSDMKTIIDFEVKNGQCIPVEAKSFFLIDSNSKTTMEKSTLYNLKLCKDIYDFFNKHPNARSCFSDGLNKQMTSIFKKHVNTDEASIEEKMGITPHYYGNSSLESQVKNSLLNPINPTTNPLLPPIEPSVQLRNTRISLAMSPIIASHGILRDCYKRGLSRFITDPTIWKEPQVLPPAKKSQSTE